MVCIMPIIHYLLHHRTYVQLPIFEIVMVGSVGIIAFVVWSIFIRK